MEIQIIDNALTKRQVFNLTFFSCYITYIIFACTLILLMYVRLSSFPSPNEPNNFWFLPVFILLLTAFHSLIIATLTTAVLFIAHRLSITSLYPIQSNGFSLMNYFYLIGLSVFILCAFMFWPIALIISDDLWPDLLFIGFLIMPFINGLFNSGGICCTILLLIKFNCISFKNAQSFP